MISSPLSGWLLDHYNWRAMFIVQGLLPLLFAPVWAWCVEDRPEQAEGVSGKPGLVPAGTARPAAQPLEGRRRFLRDRNIQLSSLSMSRSPAALTAC